MDIFSLVLVLPSTRLLLQRQPVGHLSSVTPSQRSLVTSARVSTSRSDNGGHHGNEDMEFHQSHHPQPTSCKRSPYSSPPQSRLVPSDALRQVFHRLPSDLMSLRLTLRLIRMVGGLNCLTQVNEGILSTVHFF